METIPDSRRAYNTDNIIIAHTSNPEMQRRKIPEKAEVETGRASVLDFAQPLVGS
jgi:hypothetical protein